MYIKYNNDENIALKGLNWVRRGGLEHSKIVERELYEKIYSVLNGENILVYNKGRIYKLYSALMKNTHILIILSNNCRMLILSPPF